MIDTKKFINKIKKYSNFFVGVPDSVLKNFTNNLGIKKNLILFLPMKVLL